MNRWFREESKIRSSRIFRMFLVFMVISACTASDTARAEDRSSVRLIVQITIDQLRGDLPTRFKNRFGPGGFRYLMDKGIYFANAHYNYSDTETAPGHATLCTGSMPAQHGIIGGDWWDESKKKVVYSVEDDKYPVFTDKVDTDPGKTGGGRAPTSLLASTIADEIYLASDQRAKIYSVAGKDRSAIIPSGRVGKAFWLMHGDFVTSSYYYKALPDWVVAWNNRKLADSYKTKTWDLLQDRKTYWRADKDDMPYEGSYKHLGRTMPKKLFSEDASAFYKGLEYTIVSDELVTAFSKDLIDHEKLGQGSDVDYLSISLSSTDMVGHTWGVSSLEAEDNMLRVDKELANLFSFIDEKVGLDKTLIVLAADHGSGEVTEYLQSLGFPAKRIDPRDFVSKIDTALKARFSTGQDSVIQTFVYPYLYLNSNTLAKYRLDVATVENAVSQEAMKYPGISFAPTRSAITSGSLPDKHPHMLRVINTFHPERSGNVHIVADQQAVIMHHPWNQKPGLHGSPWTYDTFIPIMFAGPGIAHKEVFRRVGPEDIAPTISSYLGIKPPSAALGLPLLEVFEQKRDTNSASKQN